MQPCNGSKCDFFPFFTTFTYNLQHCHTGYGNMADKHTGYDRFDNTQPEGHPDQWKVNASYTSSKNTLERLKISKNFVLECLEHELNKMHTKPHQKLPIQIIIYTPTPNLVQARISITLLQHNSVLLKCLVDTKMFSGGTKWF